MNSTLYKCLMFVIWLSVSFGLFFLFWLFHVTQVVDWYGFPVKWAIAFSIVSAVVVVFSVEQFSWLKFCLYFVGVVIVGAGMFSFLVMGSL